MKRKLFNKSVFKQAALAVPAAALMLGSAHGGTVGFNLDSYYYDDGAISGSYIKWVPGATPAPDGFGLGYQTSGWAVTAKAFGVEPANWFAAQVFAWWGDSPVDVTTNKGTMTAHITAPHCLESGIGTQLPGWVAQTVAPGNDQVTFTALMCTNNGGTTPSVSLSGLAADFPHGYVVQTIAAWRGLNLSFNGVVFTDGITLSHSDYTTTYNRPAPSDGNNGTIGLSAPSRTYTSDTLQIRCDIQTSGSNSVLSGFIITDKPVASTPAYSTPLVPPGGTIALSPGVVGVQPMNYQWRANGVPIPGAISATYTKTGASGADNANYDVVVINAYGSVTSEVATVTVDLPAAITWAAPVTCVGDTDVSTTGTAVFAYDCNGSDQTVNSVSFTAVGSGVTIANLGGNYKGFASGTGSPAADLSPDYLAVLTGGNYNDGGLATITLNKLIPGHQYQVQFWVDDSRNLNNGQNRAVTVTSGGNSVTLKYPANLAGALGQYTIGIFTANQASQVITLLGNYATQFNAIQLRDLGIPVVTSTPIFSPAPGSYIGAQPAAISSGPGSTVYYTMDGTTPNASSPHGTSPVLVTLPAPATTTVKAYGTHSGRSDSPVASATYSTYTTPAVPTWNNMAGGSWIVASNWVHNVVAGGANVTADFSQLTLSGNTTVTFDSAPVIGNLVFGDLGNKYAWTLNTGSLTLAATNPPTITVNNQAATINPPLAGVSGLTKAGPGTLTLGSDNPYTGVTTINGGVLVLNTANFNTYRGAGIFINNGSTLRVTQTGGSVRYDFQGTTFTFDSVGGGAIDTGTGVNFVFATADNLTNHIVTSGGARNSIIGNSGINMGGNAGDATVFEVARGTDASSDLTVQVPMGNLGLGGVIKTGNGILELAGVNTYSGGTTVAGGILSLTGQLAGPGPVTVNDNTTLRVTAGGAKAVIVGASMGTFGSSGASALSFSKLSSTTVAPIAVSNLVVNGTVTINVSGGLPVAQLPLIKYGGTKTGSGTFGLGTLPAGVSAVLVNNTANQSVDLNVTAAPVSFIVDLPVGTNHIYVGGNYSFSVVAGGSTPLTYLWKKNGSTPVGANSATLTLSSATTSDSGSYSVTVTNALGSVQSATTYLVVLPLPSYPALVEANNPNAYWPLIETSGTAAEDYVGHHDATYSGAVTLGVPGLTSSGSTAVSFAGGTATALYSDSLNPETFSVEFWALPANLSAAYVVCLQDRTTGYRIGYAIQKNNWSSGWDFSFGTDPAHYSTISSPTAVVAGALYYVVATYDGTSANLYVNGVLAASKATTYQPANSGAVDFTIGSRNGNTPYNGVLSDVAVYNYALTPAQIQQHLFTVTPLQIGMAPTSGIVLDSKPTGVLINGQNLGAVWAASGSGVNGQSRTGVMEFSSSNSTQVIVSADPAFNTTSGSILFWVKTSQAGMSTPAMLYDRRTGPGDVIVMDAQGLLGVQATVAGGVVANQFSGVTPVNDGNWHLIAYVYDQSASGSTTLYVDGNYDNSSATSAAWSWPAFQEIELGRSHDGYWASLQGSMSDLMIYNRMLTEAEVQAAVAGSPVTDSSLVGRYKFTAAPVAGYRLTTTPIPATIQGSGNVSGAYNNLGGYPSFYVPADESHFFRAKD